MPPSLKPARKKARRRNILLALGWNVFEFNLGVAEYAKKANWILNDVMCHSSRIPSQWRGDGIITHVNGRMEKELLSLLRGAKVPVVNLGAHTASFINSRVIPDNERIGELAADHLLGRGFEHFAFFRLSSTVVVMERMEGFRKRILAEKREFHEINFEPKLTAGKNINSQYSRLLPWLAAQLKKLPKPLAAMAQYDGEANDVVRAALSAGLRVPEDVAVIGVDNDPVYSTLGPIPLTSVDSSRRLAGYRAAELLDTIIDGDRWVEKTVRIPPANVIVRTSTDIIAVEDPYVSKALHCIWSRFRTGISIEEIVSVSGISRRGLYTRFERIVGHPIYEELMRQRLDCAKQLLRDSDEKLQFIADECGLVDAERLSKSFKRFCGMSPMDYRAQHRTEKP